VVETDSGYSTQIACRTLRRNESEGALGKLTCIEPYPEWRLTEFGGEFELIRRVHDVSVELQPETFFSSIRVVTFPSIVTFVLKS
jgi:hypothetical protein